MMEPVSEAEPGWHDADAVIRGLRTRVRVSEPVSAATPILHLHGFGISGRYLLPTARLLAGRARNIVPDLPGYGRSERPSRPLTIPELAAAAVAVLDACEVERAVVVGNSMGCPVAIELAERHPGRVERLVLVSPAGGQHNQPFAKAVAQLALDGVRESPRMARVAVPDYVRFGPINSLRLFRAMTLYPARDRLLATRAPTLAVFGDRDPLMPGREQIVETAAQLPGKVSVVVIEGAAHAINFSHPGELAHVIGSWLDGVAIVDDPAHPGRSRVVAIPSLVPGVGPTVSRSGRSMGRCRGDRPAAR
jgi:pimeloyl-ACP methyl ester carboxylesterase